MKTAVEYNFVFLVVTESHTQWVSKPLTFVLVFPLKLGVIVFVFPEFQLL